MSELRTGMSSNKMDFLQALRRRLEPHFSNDIAVAGTNWTTGRPSAGHCAAVSLIVRELLGGEFVSATVDGISHWYNRLSSDGGALDADITGDQFGFEPVRSAKPGELYPNSRVRSENDVNTDTIARAAVLAERASLKEVAERLRRWNITGVMVDDIGPIGPTSSGT